MRLIRKCKLKLHVVSGIHIRRRLRSGRLSKNGESTCESERTCSANHGQFLRVFVAHVFRLNAETSCILRRIKCKINDVESRTREVFHRDYKTLCFPNNPRRVFGTLRQRTSEDKSSSIRLSHRRCIASRCRIR